MSIVALEAIKLYLFGSLTDIIKIVIIVIPIIAGFWAFRKGYGFIIKNVKKA
jgi:hypothetical protein